MTVFNACRLFATTQCKQQRRKPFASSVDVSFWHELTNKKLDVFKLSDSAVEINGAYCVGANEAVPARVMLETKAFEARASYVPPTRHYAVAGTLKNFNTIEEFHNSDKKKLFESAVSQIWSDVVTGAALRSPALLNRFLAITFADLKVRYTRLFCLFVCLFFFWVVSIGSWLVFGCCFVY